MRLAIADPPYPPFVGAGGRKNRASRWYGDGQRSATDRPADRHPDARRWDDPNAHRLLFLELCQDYDGFALATSPDGIEVYRPFPPDVRIMAWVKPNAQPGAHRLRSCWEPVIIRVPEGRRSNRGGRGQMPDVLTCPAPRGFIGRKPAEWTRWVLDAMSFDPDTDEVVDLFAGSGAVAAEVAQGTLEVAL